MPGDPFQIDGPPHAPLSRAAIQVARPFLSWLLQLGECRRLYRRAQESRKESFAARVLEACAIQVMCSADELVAIPTHGPLIVAANHPHGALDGLAIASEVAKVRPDVRLVANHLLARIPELTDVCFFVDPFGGPGSDSRSRSGLRGAHLWLRRGGSLIVFPAGEVAHERRSDGSIVDSPWHTTIVRLARSTGATVTPAFIAGSNSALFYAAGRLHPALRTLLLSRELLQKQGQTLAVRFGPGIAARDLADDESVATHTIRASVERLGRRRSESATGRIAGEIQAEIAALPASARLVESGAFQVFCTGANEIPKALREIGRLREVAFNAAGEGTGRELDLDRFDDYYLHLFVWDDERRLIAGAYRIGLTDRIAATQGVDGLYTRTLFRYDARLIARLSPALELGRSFVRPEYQRNYNALMMLWKGIGQFVVRNPRYRVLFGPVSISSRYSDTTQQLLMAFLRQNHLDRSLAELVEAVNPTAPRASAASPIPQSIDEVNRLVMKTERNGSGVPVLLRQYLKLNARLIGFNVDPDFNDALDALMMVDLTTVDRSILNRYLGSDGAGRLLAHHSADHRQSAA